MTRFAKITGISLALAVMGLTAACETAAERAAREEREAYIESIDVEELKEGLETVNPDPYANRRFRRAKDN